MFFVIGLPIIIFENKLNTPYKIKKFIMPSIFLTMFVLSSIGISNLIIDYKKFFCILCNIRKKKYLTQICSHLRFKILLK